MTTKESQEPQNVDWDGLYKIRDKCSGRVLDKLNHWLYANDPRKAGNNPVEQTPPPIDVEALKREVVSASHLHDEKNYGCSSGNTYVKTFDAGIVWAIDHLSSAGYLRAPLPKIEGLEEAITLENDCLYMSPDEARAHGIVLDAARAYQKASGG